jgi:hypothetical protein
MKYTEPYFYRSASGLRLETTPTQSANFGYNQRHCPEQEDMRWILVLIKLNAIGWNALQDSACLAHQ